MLLMRASSHVGLFSHELRMARCAQSPSPAMGSAAQVPVAEIKIRLLEGEVRELGHSSAHVSTGQQQQLH